MTKKRRNSGRNKPAGARGSVRRVRCEQSGVLVPKDKAVKRFIVRNIVDASAVRDIQDASALEGYALPKIYRKVYYSVSAAIHSKIVRVRSHRERHNREPPPRYRPPSLFDHPLRDQAATGYGGRPASTEIPVGGGFGERPAPAVFQRARTLPGQSSLAAIPIASRNKDDGWTAATKSVGGADW